jgi:hypothetical protein
MSAVRRVLFFVAFTVAMKAMFGDVNALATMWEPLAAMPVRVREAVLYLPYALVAAVLLTRSEVWARLPATIALYLPLAVVVAALVAAPGAAARYPELAPLAIALLTLALVMNIVMILTRLTPKPGFIYEGSSFPSVQAFVALALLLGLSLPLAAPVLTAAHAGHVLESIPVGYANLIPAAIVVAAFIVASGIRFRTLQPNSAGAWMGWGIALWLLAQFVEPAAPLLQTYGLHKQAAAAWFIAHAGTIRASLELLAHALLFAGAFSLLSHLLPARDSIARM